MSKVTEILKHFEDWCLAVHTQTPPRGNELNIREAEQAVMEWHIDEKIDQLQHLRGVMGKYKGDGVFDKKLFVIIELEIENLNELKRKLK